MILLAKYQRYFFVSCPCSFPFSFAVHKYDDDANDDNDNDAAYNDGETIYMRAQLQRSRSLRSGQFVRMS